MRAIRFPLGCMLSSLLGFCSVAAAEVVTVNFDDVVVTGSFAWANADWYLDKGLRFNREIPLENVQVAEPAWYPTFAAGGGTPKNFLVLSLAVDPRMTIEASFVIPGTSTPCTVPWVRVDAFDAQVGSVVGTLFAYDAQGTPIGQDSRTTPASQHETLSIEHSGIARILLAQDGDGGGFDNLQFLVPEPAVTSLLLGGIGILLRRRN